MLMLFLPGIRLFAQDASIFKQYYLTPSIVNPAFTGINYYNEAILSVRKQWVGIPDAPSTFLLSGNFRTGTFDFYDPKGFVNKGPLKLKDRLGLGASLYRDTSGPESLLGGNISYAYHVPVTSTYELSFGMAVMVNYHSFRSDLLKPDQPDDPYLLNGNDDQFDLNFNLGALLHSQNNFFGISVLKLLPDMEKVNEQRHFQPSLFLMAGQKFPVNEFLIFEPSVIVKKLGKELLSADLYTKLYVKRLNWVALSYGTTGDVKILMALHLVKMLHAGYSYEYTIGKVSSYNYGTHSIYLGFNLGLYGIEGIRTTIFRKI
jgi:type IX secretion system PorP/SprF family membrane protein